MPGSSPALEVWLRQLKQQCATLPLAPEQPPEKHTCRKGKYHPKKGGSALPNPLNNSR